MIIIDDYIEELSNRLDIAHKKFWEDWFDKHFNKGNSMTDMIKEVKTETVEINGQPVEVTITTGVDTDINETTKAMQDAVKATETVPA